MGPHEADQILAAFSRWTGCRLHAGAWREGTSWYGAFEVRDSTKIPPANVVKDWLEDRGVEMVNYYSRGEQLLVAFKDVLTTTGDSKSLRLKYRTKALHGSTEWAIEVAREFARYFGMRLVGNLVYSTLQPDCWMGWLGHGEHFPPQPIALDWFKDHNAELVECSPVRSGAMFIRFRPDYPTRRVTAP